MSLSKPRYVVLDLDSTCIWARETDLGKYPTDDERNFWITPVNSQFHRVTTRKHLRTFLNQLHERGYKIIVWSAGKPAYVKDIVSVAFKGIPIDYVLTHDHVDSNRLKKLANITKLIPDFHPANARLVDDNRDHSKGQEQSCILIKPFEFMGDHPTHEEDDDVLATMADEVDRSFG